MRFSFRLGRGAPAAAALALVPLVTGCRDRSTDENAPPVASEAPVASAPAASAPRDHLASGELVEGPEQVFGIPLPRGFSVKATFTTLATATGPSKSTDVANYLRARIPASSSKIGAGSTIFEHVQSPSAPGHDFIIRVEPDPHGSGTLLTFRDVTQPAMVPNVPEADRWKGAGLTPDGRILDPKHLH
jgi:hypothetical protein